jgi:hypothetical protein
MAPQAKLPTEKVGDYNERNLPQHGNNSLHYNASYLIDPELVPLELGVEQFMSCRLKAPPGDARIALFLGAAMKSSECGKSTGHSS